MKKFLLVLSTVILVAAFSVPAFSMDITLYDNAENLAQALVGSGVTISNVSYTGAEGASGYFAGGTAAGLGFDSGIVLTSGAAANIDGTTNTSDGISTSNGEVGDSYLTTLGGQDTYDATLLSFDFVSSGDSVYFNYAFGSDEYNEFVGQFNDVFAFIFEGTNLAVLPDGTGVSVNSINNDSNPTYYNDNDNNGAGAGAFAFEYDGFTNMLTASATGLTIGDTYSITLAIADGGDSALDSGVFLQAGSFSDTPTNPVPEPSTILLMGVGLLGLMGYSRKQFSKKS